MTDHLGAMPAVPPDADETWLEQAEAEQAAHPATLSAALALGPAHSTGEDAAAEEAAAVAYERTLDLDRRAADPMYRAAHALLYGADRKALAKRSLERDLLVVQQAALVLTAFPEYRGVPSPFDLPYAYCWQTEQPPPVLDPRTGRPHRCARCRAKYTAPTSWDAAGSTDGLCYHCATEEPRKAIAPMPAGEVLDPGPGAAQLPLPPAVPGTAGAKPGRVSRPRTRTPRRTRTRKDSGSSGERG